MNSRIRRAFDGIRADEALLKKTADFVRGKSGPREARASSAKFLRLAGALAALAVLAVGILGFGAYFTAAAYVSIDVNPSVELTLNRFDRVIGAHAFNEEGNQLLKAADVGGEKYDRAVILLVEQLNQTGYFSGTPLVSVTVQTTNAQNEKPLCNALLYCLNAQRDEIPAATEIEVFPVSEEVRDEAYGCHMSPAKYLAIQELLAVDETATSEEYGQYSILQIRQRTQQCRQESGHSGYGGNNTNGENGTAGGDANGNGGMGGNGTGHRRGYGCG